MIKKKVNSAEILAPCGSTESVYAAVRCGADAIYVGGKDFSARQNAGNFTLDELKIISDYCHLCGVKIYLAVNTILFDSQFKNLYNFICQCASLGIDAFIVQDIGLASFIKKIIPDMTLHSSTQMTVHTVNGAIFARQIGFSRIVAARELCREQIKEICGTGIEVEVFVHGALCMSVSGQCYMSAIIGSRSANRGLCAQACRLPFTASDNNNEYALSLKDLSLISYLNELKDMGVVSFKIEGRMKRPEYVAAAVTSCVDTLNGENVNMDDLRSVFSRSGFTDGYYTGLRKDMFGIRQKEDVCAASDVIPKFKNLYSKECKKSHLSFSIKIKNNSPVILNAYDSDGFSVCIVGDIPQKALNRQVNIQQLEKQFSKLGDTIFEFNGINAEIEEGLMLSSALLNDLRRRAVDAIYTKRIKVNTPVYKTYDPVFEIHTVKKTKNPEIRIRIKHIHQFNILNLEKIKYITLPLKIISENYDRLIQFTEKIIIEPPRFIAEEKQTTENLRNLYNLGFKHLLCNNISYIYTGKVLGFMLHGDFGLNIANSYSLQFLKNIGFADTIISLELKLSQISNLSCHIPFGIIAYGRIPLMLTRNCPIKKISGCKSCRGFLTDRTKRKIPIECHENYTELLNPEILYMADRINELNCIDFIELMFSNETSDEVSQIIMQFLSKSKINTPKCTRGLYYRGVN